MRWLLVAWTIVWAAVAMPWSGIDGVARWERVFWPPFQPLRMRDAVLNVLVFVVFGSIAIAARWPWMRVILSAALISVTTELLQVFAPNRWPATNDVVMNVAGAIIGAAAMTLYLEGSSGRTIN